MGFCYYWIGFKLIIKLINKLKIKYNKIFKNILNMDIILMINVNGDIILN